MKLALFFTYSYSIREWEKTGILQRELLFYNLLKPYGVETNFVTYGSPSQETIATDLGDFKVFTKPDNLSNWKYSLAAPFIHRKALKQCDVLKTHQNQGAITGVIAKLITGKPLIARCGYLKSEFAKLENEKLSTRAKIWLEEALSFHCADVVCVSSEEQAKIAARRYLIKKSKIRVCPNGIDSVSFQPRENRPEEFTVCFVGRFSWKKGPDVLLKAVEGLEGVRLVMIGDGGLLEECKTFAAERKLNVQFIGRIENKEIPAYLNSSSVFVIPSHHEGSPKTLLEAMSCGLPVIGTDGFGVDEVFTDGNEGLKVRFGDVEGLRKAILWIKEHPAEAKEMGNRSRQRVMDYYSIDKALARELTILEELTGNKVHA
jgi:glycosyltransferase involved in cell wall biosynthesis